MKMEGRHTLYEGGNKLPILGFSKELRTDFPAGTRLKSIKGKIYHTAGLQKDRYCGTSGTKEGLTSIGRFRKR